MTTGFRTNRRRRTIAVALTVLPLGLTACSSQAGGPTIGMKRASVDLSFTDTSIAVAAPPILTQLLAPPVAAPVPPATIILPQPPPVSLQPVCKSFSKYSVHSAKPLDIGVTTPLKPGSYSVLNKGTISLGAPTGGKPAFTQKFPVLTSMQVLHVKETEVPADPHDNVAGQDLPTSVFPQPPYYGGTYDVKEDLGNGGYTMTTYLLQKGEVDIIKRVWHIAATLLSPATTVTFTPPSQHPLKFMQLGAGNGGVGANWADSAVDPSTGMIGIIRGSIPVSKVVNVCGKPVYAYVVRESELFVSVSASGAAFQSETDDNVENTDSRTPNVDPFQVAGCWKPGACDPIGRRDLMNEYWVANQYGGLFVGKVTHTTTTVAPLAITTDNVATLSSITPKK